MKRIFLSSALAASAVFAQPNPTTAPKARPVSTVYVSGNSSYVGVFVAEIDAERMKSLKLKEERGVEVTKVEEDSPAAKAGIKTGDVVLDYNGQRVEGIEQFKRFVRETPPNRDVKVGLVREGRPQTIVVKVGVRKGGMVAPGMEPMITMAPRMSEMPEIRIPQMAGVRPGMVFWSSSMLGIEAEAIDGQLASFFGVKEGVLVRNVAKGSTAEKSGIKAGDVISKVDDTAVSSPSELTRAVRTARQSSKKSFPLTVTRDKKELTITVTVEDDDRSNWPPAGEGFRLPVGNIIKL
ncbi:MAG: PDZ domain-containing protein [Acidobacteria bacterium]|nr:PDZ domain-containing protein [Acidobacteriota bacterium]